MTNEEAKEKLYMEWQKFLENNIDYAGISEAYQIAFKALEQEPKTIQEIQAESEKYQKAFEDGYEQGYAQARFDYEQEPILDKIKSEIEQLTSRYSISKERGGMGQVEWSDRLIKESDVLQIIDKYRKGE